MIEFNSISIQCIHLFFIDRISSEIHITFWFKNKRLLHTKGIVIFHSHMKNLTVEYVLLCVRRARLYFLSFLQIVEAGPQEESEDQGKFVRKNSETMSASNAAQTVFA